ncbi:MAG: DUF4167 domain-containing protein [Paracoccaceae bacterium]|jgi:hypothetical protein|nr:DUF4167 domain-containing protein [Paracoccaceae bacterium]
MRSSKSRSRSKSNRQRSVGNVINRVFDSSGPESKVRGTPQQIIDKYLMLARDAQLSNDRVAEQNFLQHAEHYTRMLGEAQREMAREQEERQRQQNQNNSNQNGNQNNNGNQNGGNQSGGYNAPRDRYEPRNDDARTDEPRETAQPALDVTQPEDDGPGLVETPEMRAETAADSGAEPTPEGASEGKSSKSRSRRSPRKPREPRPEGQDTAPAPVGDSSGE